MFQMALLESAVGAQAHNTLPARIAKLRLQKRAPVASVVVHAGPVRACPWRKAVGQPFDIFFTKEDRDVGEPSRILDIATREGKFEAEGVRVRGDGTTFLAHVVLDAVRGAHDELIGFTKITRDISEVKGG